MSKYDISPDLINQPLKTRKGDKTQRILNVSAYKVYKRKRYDSQKPCDKITTPIMTNDTLIIYFSYFTYVYLRKCLIYLK